MSYDPTTGEWMEPDPLGYINGMNPYLMEEGNIVNHLDPTGLLSEADSQQWLKDNINTIRTDINGNYAAGLGAIAAVYVELRRTGVKNFAKEATSTFINDYINNGAETKLSLGRGQCKTDFAEFAVTHDTHGTFKSAFANANDQQAFRREIIDLIENHVIELATSYMQYQIDQYKAAHATDSSIPDISGMSGVLATMYNLGPSQTPAPHANPTVGGSDVTIDGQTKSFGEWAQEFANSDFAKQYMQQIETNPNGATTQPAPAPGNQPPVVPPQAPPPPEDLLDHLQRIMPIGGF